MRKLILFLVFLKISDCYFGSQEDDDCFCQLQGKIDDCTCNVDTVDHFNNVKIYPRLRSLLQKDFFRFFKINLFKKCPFWQDDSQCGIRYCHVEPCKENEVPVGLKEKDDKRLKLENKYVKDADCKHGIDNKLGEINTTISDQAREDFALWSAYDDAQENFCLLDDFDEDSNYVDLLLNPERFTGYKGDSAHRIWQTIYSENCFRPNGKFNSYIQSHTLNNMCLEERVFYRAISGLHASINIHVCAKYLLRESSFKYPQGEWGQNLEEFHRKFSPEMTNGEGPSWLRNLYFLYLLELRALQKASFYMEKEEFYTGNDSEDWDTRLAIKDLLNIVRNFPHHFDESTMFKGHVQAKKLKQEFKQHFRNISSIMDCVGCEKCKLWGKLQVQGLGTALKILFSGKFDKIGMDDNTSKKNFQLLRTEIVALLNSIGRLSTSIYELDEFRFILR
ncbi:ero1-like protein [Harmonia axyridis]|uniref:ero1-like protein n=1 Tax=Harmonia axyridis TaxID=115357 RepID=UPI001E27869F|nr:ero1-like protein [Harmonia axyridis]